MKPAGRFVVTRLPNVPRAHGGRQDRVAARHVAAGGELRVDGAGERRASRDVGARGRRRRDLDEIARPGLERQVAGDRHASRRPGRPRREHTAAVDRQRADRSGPRQRTAGIHRREDRGRDRAVDQQRAAVDRGRAGVGVDTRSDVTVPPVDFCNWPAPASTPFTVPLCRSNVVDADTVAVDASTPPVS